MKEKTKAVIITKRGFDLLNAFVEKLGKASSRMGCRPLVLEHAVSKLNDNDVPKIVDQLYTAKDRLEELLAKVNAERPDNPITQNELLETLISNFSPTQVHKVRKSKENTAS